MHGLSVNGSRVLRKLHLQFFRWLIPSAAWLHFLKNDMLSLNRKTLQSKGAFNLQNINYTIKHFSLGHNSKLYQAFKKKTIWLQAKKHSPSALKKTSIMLRLGKCNKIWLWILSVWLEAITHFCVSERNFCLCCWELSFLDYWVWITSRGHMCPSVNIWAWLKADWASLLTLRLFSGAKLNLN